MKGSLRDDRKAGGEVSWQGLLVGGGRVTCWGAEPRWDSGCCGQGHGYSPGRRSFTTLFAVDWPGCRGRNVSNSLPTSPCSPFRGIALSWE